MSSIYHHQHQYHHHHHHQWTPDPSSDLAPNYNNSVGSDSQQPPPPPQRLRVAQACEKCRIRKAKCSGERPSCQRCISRGLLCGYSPPGRVVGRPTTTPLRTSGIARMRRKKRTSSCETTPTSTPSPCTPVSMVSTLSSGGEEARMQYPLSESFYSFPSGQCDHYASSSSSSSPMPQHRYPPVVQHSTQIVTNFHPGIHHAESPVHSTWTEMDPHHRHHHIVALQHPAERTKPIMDIPTYSSSPSIAAPPLAAYSPNGYHHSTLYPPSRYW